MNEDQILPIGEEQIRKAMLLLSRYRQGKANLESRIIENEQWYKLRHWGCMEQSRKSPVEPVSGWLFNAIANKHADAMDHIPAPAILPREEADLAQAQALSSVVPVVLEQNDFEQVYDRVWDYKLKSGTGVYGVFWDKDKLGGLGDITVRKVDVLNLFWESGITDIQQSANLFHVQLQSNDLLLQEYPWLQDRLGSSAQEVRQYLYDDTVDTADKTAVVDWYYKKRLGSKTVLHYCKFVGDTVLFATENEPAFQERGWYDHGLYPFVFDPLFSVEGSPCGFGYIDIGKSAQEYIDRGNQAILQNLLVNARPRHFIRSDGEVNEQEYADLSRDFIHVQGNLGQDSILPVQTRPLNDIYVTIINNKISELKEVTGNRDISTGGTASGVTAASAIAAMQEAGSKLSRDNIKSSYRAFRQVVLMIIELIRQFYDVPRCFRILGSNGGQQFLRYGNADLLPQHQGEDMGEDMGYRLPVFDVQVTAQKQSAYSRLSQNEMALQFFNAGFFDPARAQQALTCLEMMDFDRKELVLSAVAERARQWSQALPMGSFSPDKLEALGGSSHQEHYASRLARERVANGAAPL